MILKNFSVTQVKAYRRCPRYWHDLYVSKKKVEKTEGLTRGDELHVSIEHRLKTGVFLLRKLESEVDFGEYTVYVEALRPHFAPAAEPVFIEHWMSMPTRQGPPFVGKIDYVRHTLALPRLIDWKSTRDPRWIMTPEQVHLDIQTNIYAHHIFEEGLESDVIDAGLVYVVLGKRGRPPKDPEKVKVVPVFTRIMRDQARQVWNEVQADLDEMVALAAEVEDRNLVTAKVTACGDYGGCPFRVDCGISPLSGLASKSKKNEKEKENVIMGFRDRLKGGGSNSKSEEKTEEKVEKVETKSEEPSKGEGKFVDRMREKKAQGAPTPGQVVPNDAPARTSGGADPLPEETTEAAKADGGDDEPRRGRGRPKGSKKAQGFIIYVDCLPAKGGEDVTYAEDWWGSIEMKLNELAAEERKPHWMLLGFAEQKAAIALAVQDRVEAGGLPPRMLVTSSSGTISRDVLPLLIPHATEVVRALRG